MGVSLDYCTTAIVPSHVKSAIKAEAQQLVPAHNWWSESLNFFDPGEGDGRLHGGTKIFLTGYSTNDGGYMEVDPDEDSLMAYRDNMLHSRQARGVERETWSVMASRLCW